MRHVGEGQPSKFLLAVTEQLAQRRIDLEPTTIRCQKGDADRRILERHPEPLARTQQRLLSLLPSGQIEAGANPTRDPALPVAQSRGEPLDPSDGTVRALEAILDNRVAPRL